MKIRWNILIIAGALVVSLSAHAVSLDLLPASSSVNLGDPVQVELRISGLAEGTAPSLGGYDFLLAFNPAVLGFGNFTFGDPGPGESTGSLGIRDRIGIRQWDVRSVERVRDLAGSGRGSGRIPGRVVCLGNNLVQHRGQWSERLSNHAEQNE